MGKLEWNVSTEGGVWHQRAIGQKGKNMYKAYPGVPDHASWKVEWHGKNGYRSTGGFVHDLKAAKQAAQDYDNSAFSVAKEYRRKPLVVKGMQLNAGTTAAEIQQFCPDAKVESVGGKLLVTVNTFNGPVHASEGDYLLQDTKGKFYPCNPEVFSDSYDEIT